MIPLPIGNCRLSIGQWLGEDWPMDLARLRAEDEAITAVANGAVKQDAVDVRNGLGTRCGLPPSVR